MVFVAVAVFLTSLAVDSQPGKKAYPSKVLKGAASDTTAAPTTVPAGAPSKGYPQGYQIVTDVLDGFGGAMESDNYGIPVNSGGQALSLGVTQSDNYVIKAGFVHASYVMRGDANADGVINVADIVYLVNFLYRGGIDPCPMESGDATCDGIVNVADIVFLVNYLYREGNPPDC